MLDDLLTQLGRAPPTGLLDGMDDRVMAALAQRKRDMTQGKRMTAFAAVVSLGGGAFAGAALGEPITPIPPLSPFAPINALAPSALLDAQ